MAGDYGNGTYSETQEIRTSGGNVTERAAEMADEIGRMNTEFQNAESVWKGQAFENLKGTFSNFETIFKSYSDMFDDLGAGIKQTASTFEETEEENSALASRSEIG